MTHNIKRIYIVNVKSINLENTIVYRAITIVSVRHSGT